MWPRKRGNTTVCVLDALHCCTPRIHAVVSLQSRDVNIVSLLYLPSRLNVFYKSCFV